MSKNVLSVENVTMQFGGVVAVDNLNLEVNEGEIVALIGPTALARPQRSMSSPVCTPPPTGGCASMRRASCGTIPPER